MSKRRKARETALQALYASELSGQDWKDAVADMARRRGSSADSVEYAERIASGVSSSREKLDRMIEGCLENWRLERISLIDLTILRIALTELMQCPEVPTVVIINEAIEIANRFSSEKAGRFVNGILDRLAREVRVD